MAKATTPTNSTETTTSSTIDPLAPRPCAVCGSEDRENSRTTAQQTIDGKVHTWRRVKCTNCGQYRTERTISK